MNLQSVAAPEGSENALDRQLAALIDPWLEHMRWRPDFEQWRQGRLWQENKQKRNLEVLRRFLNVAGLDTDLAKLKALDLGCGMGGFSVALARAGVQVQPYDYNPAYCRITRLRGQRYGLDLQPVNGGGEHLPFPDAYFDLIVCLDVLEHVQRPADLMAEVYRCLKPGGLLYLTAINRFAFNDPHYHLRWVNWLPRRWATPFLKLTGRYKDNSRFTDRQSLESMHYFRYGQLPRLARRYGFSRTVELGELEWGLNGFRPLQLATSRKKGFRPKLAGLLQKLRLAAPLYRLYRSFYKGTYQLMMVKPGRS